MEYFWTKGSCPPPFKRCPLCAFDRFKNMRGQYELATFSYQSQALMTQYSDTLKYTKPRQTSSFIGTGAKSNKVLMFVNGKPSMS